MTVGRPLSSPSFHQPSIRPIPIPVEAEPEPELPPSEGSVLVIDSSLVSRRFVELALKGFAVETAKDAAAALEILQTTIVDLILCDTTLPDMNGLRLLRRLQEESRLGGIPFVFLTADTGQTTKLQALRAGAEDYLTKPCSTEELHARCQVLIRRQRRLRDSLRRRTYDLAGDFSAITSADLLVLLEMGQKTGTLGVVTRHASGSYYFEKGRIVHAFFGSLVGDLAVYQLVATGTGRFEFTSGQTGLDPGLHTISESTTALVMESARRLDEGQMDTAKSSIPRAPETAARPVTGMLARPALEPSMLLARQFEEGIKDPFSLGELSCWSASQLKKWTREEVGRHRFHVLLIADLALAVSLLLPLAAPPTERWVLESLSAEEKTPGLVVHLKNDRVFDIVVLSARSPGAFQRALLRTPSLVLVAPPDGDIFSLGATGRAELRVLFNSLSPTVALAIGTPTLQNALEDIDVVRGRFTKLSAITGALCPGDDLRPILLEGLRLWAKSTPRLA